MAPSIYIAGPSRQLARAKAAMRLAEETGYTVLCDWTREIERNGGRANEGVDPRICERAANACLDGAVESDVMWVLLDPHHRSPGTHAELGARIYARGRGGLIMSGAGHDASIYYAGAILVDTDLEAVPFLLGRILARRTA